MTAPQYFNSRWRAEEAAAQFNQRYPVGTRVQVERGSGSGVFVPLIVLAPAYVKMPRVLVPLGDTESHPIDDAVNISFERIQPISEMKA